MLRTDAFPPNAVNATNNILGTSAGTNLPLRFITNGVQRMTITNGTGPTAGFVGINTSAPKQRLFVVGDISLRTNILIRTATNDGYRINDTTVLSVKQAGNLFVGWFAGANWVPAGVAQNTFVGNNSGFSNTTGFNNSFLGFESGKANTIGFDNTFVGNNAGL